MKKRHWLNVLKWAWLVLVFGSVIFYIAKSHEDILRYLRNISFIHLVFSMLLLVIGKLFLVQLSIQSLYGQHWNPTFTQMFYINSQMQMAKYLPGGIWHFVGRFGLYRTNGLSNTQAGKAIFVENIWLVSSAIFFGVGAGMISKNDLYFSFFGISLQPRFFMFFFAGILITWFIVMFLVNWIAFSENIWNIFFLLKLILIQISVWLFTGAGLWVLLLSITQDMQFAGIAMGSFSLSWAAGYLAIFAPSGLGVREATMSLLLRDIISTDTALLYAAVNRLVWIIVELLLGVFCEIFYGSRKLLGSIRTIDFRSQDEPHDE